MQLDPIVVSDEDWVLLEAADINSRGDIVCNAHQAGSNKSIAVILNPLIVHPPGPKNKVPSQLLYFNWLAYRFWWHFPKEFSPEEKKKILALSRTKDTTEQSNTDFSMPNISVLTQVIESLSSLQNHEYKRKIQRLLFSLMIEEVKSKLYEKE